jgi:hypothetical protein
MLYRTLWLRWAGQALLLDDSISKRVWAHLEMYEFTWRAFAALDMPRGAGIVIRPNTSALPPSIGIIDAPIDHA